MFNHRVHIMRYMHALTSQFWGGGGVEALLRVEENAVYMSQYSDVAV